MEIIEMIMSMLLVLIGPLISFAIIGGVIYLIIRAQKDLKTDTGVRKVIQEDERVNLIYKIRKDDPNFNANLIEQDIKEYANEKYQHMAFANRDFAISSYNKNGNVAELVYSIIGQGQNFNRKEFRVYLKMNILGTNTMEQETIECKNCGAVISRAKDMICPYCGQTYEFSEYNRWIIEKMEEV